MSTNLIIDVVQRRQRKGNVVDDVDIDDIVEEEFDEIMHTPKRRKLRTTSRYIFETLFLEGKDSDVTLNALSREWKLHKVRLAIEYVINDFC